MIPVNLLAIPVGLGLLAEENLHRPDVVLICDNKYVVIELQQCVGLWHEHLLSTPDARDDELQMAHLRDFSNGFIGQGRVDNYELSYVSLVLGTFGAQFQIFRLHKEFPDEHHCQDDT